MTTEEQNRLANLYYENGAKKIRKMIDRILLRFGGLSDKDKDDFYSIGNETFVMALNAYENGGDASFNTYLYNNILNRFKSEMTKRNAKKRSAEIVYDCEGLVTSMFSYDDVEAEAMILYSVDHLEPEEKVIFSMKIGGWTDAEIRKETGIPTRRFYRRLNSVRKAMA